MIWIRGGHHLDIDPDISSGTLILTGPDEDVADVYNYEVAACKQQLGESL